MRILTFILLTALAGVGCRTTQTSVSDRDDITEAVFRHIAQPAQVVDEDSHGVNLAHKVLFLSVDDFRDPDADLLRRLSDFCVPVKPISARVMKDSYSYDRVTGERGAAFYIHSIRRLSASKAEVQGDIDPGGGLRGSGYIYRVVYRGGKWSVKGQKLKWVS